MLNARILELETQLTTATASLATATSLNVSLRRELEEQERRAKKIRRGARRDRNAHTVELAEARGRRT